MKYVDKNGKPVPIGQTIISKYVVGKVGTVSSYDDEYEKMCHVKFPIFDKTVLLFVKDLEAITEEQAMLYILEH
jgi:hypothetical protein